MKHELRVILRQGCEVSVKDLESMISLLVEKKRKMEQEEAETNMQILLDFLHCLRKQKLEELNEVLKLNLFLSGSYILPFLKLLNDCFQSGRASISCRNTVVKGR